MPGVTTKEFDEFVRREKSSAAAQSQIDWDKERSEWIAYLDSLYKKIESFLKKYKDDGSIQTEYKEVDLYEENLGTYPVRNMLIHIGRRVIKLTPVGTLLIGSKGRVDVEGPSGKAALALVDKNAVGLRPVIRVSIVEPKEKREPEVESPRKIVWVWKIATPPPAVKYIELSAESFYELIMEVSNA